MSEHKYTNKLINETSPYLLQHAHNPVDWYAWGEEALQKAKEEDKPILLSIGYSACHWCHVMEHESFENEQIAKIMNDNFISVKVDREERPDLDNIYMNFVQMTTGSGGWPMTVFLTPDQVPFYGGTYFPPDDRYGRPGFPSVLSSIAETYKTRREQISKNTNEIISNLQQLSQLPASEGDLTPNSLEMAYRGLAKQFDYTYGGFGGAPKFPGSMNLSFLLRYYHRTKEREALQMVELSLDKMASGGMYDQLGGGFHRYSVDQRWLVPHFEKMLYDNALLSQVYLEAYQVTGNPFYKKITIEILDYVKREMTSPEDGFYSTQDADSEGEEGKFFVWSPDEIKSILGDKEGDLFCRFYDVSKWGNFEGKNILNIPRDIDVVADQVGMREDEFAEILERGRVKLFEVREKRIKPGRDDKILTSWNGLMMKSFVEAYNVFDREDYLEVAVDNANFIFDKLYKDSRLLVTYKSGEAKLNAYLDDYAFLTDALISLYQATFDISWLQKANSLMETTIEQFWDDSNGGFYFTSKDHEKLISRSKSLFDNALPTGNSVSIFNLLRLAVLLGKDDYRQKAERTLEQLAGTINRMPGAFGYLLYAVDFYLDTPKEIAIVGKKDDDATKSFLKSIHGKYVPNKVVALLESENGTAEEIIPLLQGKTLVEDKPAVYVCENYTCKVPVTEVKKLEELL